MKKTTPKHFDLPAHEHIRLKEEGITYNSDRCLKFRPFNTEDIKKLRKELPRHG